MNKVLQIIDIQTNRHKYIILALSLLVYGNTLFNGFVLDDRVVFTENQFVQKGIQGIPDIFSHNSFEGYFTGSGKSSSVGNERYRPLSLAFFAIQHQFVGANTYIAHLLNILFFGILCVLIYKLTSQLLSYKFKDSAAKIAFVSTLLFALHPIHTEVVANVKSLDEIFAFLFASLSFLSILNYQEKRTLKHLGLAALFFMLSLFSKESAIVFLILIPLALLLFLTKDNRALLKPVSALMVSAMIYLLCRFLALGSLTIESSKNFLDNPFLQLRGDRILDMNPFDKLGTILYSILRYIYLHIIPYPLTHDYSPKTLNTYNLFSPVALFALILIVLCIVFALLWRKTKPVYSYSILFFLIALFPVSNLVFSTGAYMGERFAFIPSFGICLAAAYFIHQKWKEGSKWTQYLLILIIISFSARTFARNLDWKDNLTLFNNDVKHSSNSAKLNSSLGFTLLEEYRNAADKQNNKHLLTQSIYHLKNAVKVYPLYSDCIFLLGNAYYLNQNYGEAVSTYEKYIQLVPSDVSIMKNYQKALREVGRKYFYEDSNNSAAKNALLKSYKLNQNDDQVLELLGSVEAEMGYLLKSLEYLLRSAEINPNNASTWANLYITYTRLGDKARAQQAINKGMEIDKDIVKKLMSVKTK